MNVTVQGLESLDAFLAEVQGQMPFANAKSLTNLASGVRKREVADLSKHIDRPTPFTKNMFGLQWATKTKLQSKVFVKDIQRKYMAYQIEGGIRKPKGTAIVVPFRARLNQYGNMSRYYIQNLLASGRAFSGTVNGIAGIWERGARALILRVAYEPEVAYQKRFPFYEIGADEAEETWRDIFDRNITDVLNRAL